MEKNNLDYPRYYFAFLPSVSFSQQVSLWKKGVLTWRDLMRNINLLNTKRRETFLIEQYLLKAESLFREDVCSLADFFLVGHKMILIPLLFSSGEAIILDIETTGLSRQDNIVSVCTLSNKELSYFVVNINLEAISEVATSYRWIVTFGGAGFDLQLLSKQFGLDLVKKSIDLKEELKSVGHHFSKIRCENFFGLKRPSLSIKDGKDASKVAKMYLQNRSTQLLNDLLVYNAVDVLMLWEVCKAYVQRVFSQHPLFSQQNNFPIVKSILSKANCSFKKFMTQYLTQNIVVKSG